MEDGNKSVSRRLPLKGFSRKHSQPQDPEAGNEPEAEEEGQGWHYE